MDMLATSFDKRILWLLIGLIAVALLPQSVARAADEFLEDEFFSSEECNECLNCNLYWHGSDGCVTSRPPRWYGGADVLVLRRDMDQEFVFATTPPPVAGDPAVVALGTTSFKDEFDAGVRFFAGYALNEWYRIEGSYFGSYYYTGDMAVDTGGMPMLDFPFGDMGSRARIRFSSTLNNAELNLRTRLDTCPQPLQMSLLFGGRFMKLDERFTYTSDGGTVNSVGVKTSNDLLGLQIGMMAQWQCHPRSWLDYEIKGAVYTDRARLSTTSNVFAGTMTAQKDVTAFSVDMSLIFNYQLTQSLSLRFGYNSMWLSGVALGARNVQTNANLLMDGPPKLDHAGFVVYHGPSFGVVWTR